MAKTPSTSEHLNEVLSDAQQLNDINSSIYHAEKVLEHLTKAYNEKPQNPVGSAINVVELLIMNLKKLKPIQNN
jgi:hypothetical protein